MVGTINRAVCAESQCRWPIPALVHVGAMVVGGSAVGLAIAAPLTFIVGILPSVVILGLCAFSGVVFAVTPGLPVWRWSVSRWQVPRRWRSTMGPYRLAVAYGTLLGIPFLTRSGPAVMYVVVLVAASISPPLIVAVAIAFAVGRAVPYLSAALWLRDLEQAHDLLDGQLRGERATDALAVACFAVLGATALAAMVK